MTTLLAALLVVIAGLASILALLLLHLLDHLAAWRHRRQVRRITRGPLLGLLLLAAGPSTLGHWGQPTPDPILAGQATFMAPGRMAEVAVTRGYIAHPDDYPAWLDAQGLVGAVALNRAGDLGRTVWVTGPAGLEGPFLVLDCAQLAHYPAREARGLVLEVDHPTAARWGMRTFVNVVVWLAFVPPDVPQVPT